MSFEEMLRWFLLGLGIASAIFWIAVAALIIKALT